MGCHKTDGPFAVICYPTYYVVQDQRFPTGPHLGRIVNEYRSGTRAHVIKDKLNVALDRGDDPAKWNPPYGVLRCRT